MRSGPTGEEEESKDSAVHIAPLKTMEDYE